MIKPKIVLIGGTGTGKTTLKNKMEVLFGLKSEVSYTSRPMRQGEVDGVDYHFVSTETFESMAKDGKFIQYNRTPDGRYYGTAWSEFWSKDLFIMSPNALKAFVDDDILIALRVFVLYAHPNDLKERLIARGSSTEEVERRIANEDGEFKYTYENTRENAIRLSGNIPTYWIDATASRDKVLSSVTQILLGSVLEGLKLNSDSHRQSPELDGIYTKFVQDGFLRNSTGKQGLDLHFAVSSAMRELSEVLDLVLKHVYYGQELDKTKIVMELGDCYWFFRVMMNILEVSHDDVIKANMAKLEARYPDGQRSDLAFKDSKLEYIKIKELLDAKTD